MSEQKRARIDFHLHSYASNITDYYATNSLSIPESYSDPIETYRLLKARGMQLVTLTDHNSIDGVLEMLAAGLPDVFISAEMTTTFPEDGCNIHVTVANMTEAQFREVDRLRGNVYEMVDYVNRQIAEEADAPSGNRIAYFMTHPLMSTQNRPYGREGALRVEHIEKAILLFDALEVRNGTRTRSLNTLTRQLLGSLTPALIERLANKHRIAPNGPTPWKKAFLGGSDDHSGINPGKTWTEFVYEGDSPTPNDLIASIRARETRAGGQHGGPVTLAHALVKLIYDGQFSPHRPADMRPMKMGRSFNMLLRVAFDSESISMADKVGIRVRLWLRDAWGKVTNGKSELGTPFERVLMSEACALLCDAEFRGVLEGAKSTDDKIFEIINALLNRIFTRYVARTRLAGSANLVGLIKEVVALVTSHLFVSLPYYLCYSHQSADKLLVRDARKRFGVSERTKLVLMTDTFFEVNGVAKTIRRMMREADRRGIDLTVVTCLDEAERARRSEDPEIQSLLHAGKLKIFTSIFNLDLPEYKELQVRCLPFLEFLRFAEKQGFTKMQVSTPGPVGITGLLAAKILQIETAATYHTSFPEYVEHLTGDISLEALAWKYMVQFYQAVDEVVVPSRFIAKLLHQRGLRNRKLLVLDRWVDIERFHPDKRSADTWDAYGLADSANVVKFVYVGRVSVEKNLSVLAAAFAALCEETDRARLIVIGDGPYADTLRETLKGVPLTCTGFLGGEDLAQAIASADAKVFPSTTDTWGNAPLEAQACGLPVIVTDRGGPQELMVDEETGFRVRGGDAESLLDAMRKLMDDDLRIGMGRAARRFVEANQVEQPFSAILDSSTFRQRSREKGTTARVAAGDAPGVSNDEDSLVLVER